MKGFMKHVVLKVNNEVACTGPDQLVESEKGYKCDCKSDKESLYLQKPSFASGQANLDMMTSNKYTFIYTNEDKSYTVVMDQPNTEEPSSMKHKVTWKKSFNCNKA